MRQCAQQPSGEEAKTLKRHRKADGQTDRKRARQTNSYQADPTHTATEEGFEWPRLLRCLLFGHVVARWVGLTGRNRSTHELPTNLVVGTSSVARSKKEQGEPAAVFGDTQSITLCCDGAGSHVGSELSMLHGSRGCHGSGKGMGGVRRDV